MTYSTTEVCRLTGATYRQLDYWARTGRIPGQPSGSVIGSGNRRRWTQADVDEVRLWLEASALLSGGLRGMVERLRKEPVTAGGRR